MATGRTWGDSMFQAQPIRGGLRRLRASTLALALAAGLFGPACAEELRIDVPPGELERALLVLAEQTRHQLLFSPDLIAGRRTPGLVGHYSPEEALARLVADDQLVVDRVGPNALALKRRPAQPSPVRAPDPARPFGDEASALPVNAQPAADPEPTLVEEVRVTGTHLRGVGPGAAPLIVMDRTELERSGHATVAAALQTLPQAYGGESTESTVGTRADRQGTNASFGTSLNLRGLGSDATLVMVDGRRMAGSGLKGDFADLSSIPAIAVERVEVLLDGASAIYGSDAVGGVVNVVLRRDFDGAELRLRGGASTRGEPSEAQAGVVFGRAWAGGSLLLAYEAYHRTALGADDRSFTRTADLRPLGGRDWRQTFAFPGNVLRVDPTTGVATPFWAIPAGQDGVGLRPSDFRAGSPNLQDPQAGVDILPDQRRQSVFAAVKQQINPRLEVSADARYSFRRARAAFGASTTIFSVRQTNPFFVSPNGAASNLIQYSFAGELPNPITRRTAENLSVSVGGRLDLGGDWQLTGYGAFAQEIGEGGNSGVINTAILSEALGNVADRPTTAFSTARDGFFNPFTGVASNSPAVLAAVGSGFTSTRTRSQVSTANLQGDGSLWALPGGDVRAAVGVQARRETFLRVGSSYTSTVAPVEQTPVDAERDVLALYGEVRVPLVGYGNARPGLQELEVTAAIRWERYSDFGRTLNPKVGAIWSPISGVRFRGTYGESFRAPALQELRDAPINSPILFSVGSERILALALQGGNPALRPETATTWTAGVDLQPDVAPDLRLSATWFRTQFKDRIDRPVSQNVAGALVDPRFAPFVRRIAPATDAEDRAYITALLADPATTTSQGVFPPESYGAVVEIRNVNTGALEVEGIDLQASYRHEASFGRLSFNANASWLLDYQQQLTPTSTTQELVGVVTNPARLRGRIAADWTRASWGAGLALNYVSSFRDADGPRISEQTTTDGYIRWEGPPGTLWSGASVSLHVRNLLDQDPPFYDNPLGFAYDPSTGDPVGRFISVQLTRRW